jgi:hypothetical protein
MPSAWEQWTTTRRGGPIACIMYEFYDVQDVETLAARIEGIIIRTIGLTYTTLW